LRQPAHVYIEAEKAKKLLCPIIHKPTNVESRSLEVQISSEKAWCENLLSAYLGGDAALVSASSIKSSVICTCSNLMPHNRLADLQASLGCAQVHMPIRWVHEFSHVWLKS